MQLGGTQKLGTSVCMCVCMPMPAHIVCVCRYVNQSCSLVSFVGEKGLFAVPSAPRVIIES